MKVLLISLGGQNIFAYGPRILSAYLKANDIQVELLLIPFVNPDKKRYFSPHWKFYDEELVNRIIAPVVPHIKAGQYDLVGISLTTNFYDHARMITERVKKELKVPVVWGGVHPTVRPDECMDYADYVIRGEGEQALLQLVKALENNESIESVGNLVYKKNNEIKKNDLHSLIQDLDSLPLQDFDYSTHYLAYNYEINKITQDSIYKVLPQGYGPTSYGYSTMATRGCPYGCSYCLNSTLRNTYKGKGKLLRKRSYQNVVEELAMIKQRIPKLTYLLFSDETFLMGKGVEWIKSFAKLYKEKVGLPFSCCFSPEDVSSEALELLIEAGLFNVQMGIQSGSKRTLIEVYDRRDNTDNILKAAGVLNGFKDDIMPLYDLILDNPYETDKDRIETIKFLLKLPRPYELQLFSLTWYPGAALTEKAIADGIVNDLLKDVYRKHYQAYERSNYYNLLISMVPYFSPRQIEKLLNKNDFFHYLAVRVFLKLWLSTRYVSGTWPYQLLKRILVKYFHVEAPVYATIPTKSNKK